MGPVESAPEPDRGNSERVGAEQPTLFDFGEPPQGTDGAILVAAPQAAVHVDAAAVGETGADVARSAADILAEMRVRLRTLPIHETTILALESTIFADEPSTDSVLSALAQLSKADRQ